MQLIGSHGSATLSYEQTQDTSQLLDVDTDGSTRVCGGQHAKGDGFQQHLHKDSVSAREVHPRHEQRARATDSSDACCNAATAFFLEACVPVMLC